MNTPSGQSIKSRNKWKKTTAENNPNENVNQEDQKSKGNVVIPYVEGVSERYSRFMKKHDVSMCMRPHTTIRSLLVHPNEKQDPKNTPNCIYEVSCKGCEQTYMGETKRAFGDRLEEHRREAEKVSNQIFTCPKRKEPESQNSNSAISDHAALGLIILLAGRTQKILEREAQKKARWIRESIWIRRRGRSVLIRDEGIYISIFFWHRKRWKISPPLSSWITTTTVLMKQTALVYETFDKNVSF